MVEGEFFNMILKGYQMYDYLVDALVDAHYAGCDGLLEDFIGMQSKVLSEYACTHNREYLRLLLKLNYFIGEELRDSV